MGVGNDTGMPWVQGPPGLAEPQGPPPEPNCALTLREAKERHQCRVCGESTVRGTSLPIVLNYGREHGHGPCLERLATQDEEHSVTTQPEPLATQNPSASDGIPLNPLDPVDARVEGDVRPNYYRVRLQARVVDTQEVVEVEVECFQMIRSLNLGFFEGSLLKYLWRAGRKTRERLSDARKVLTYAKQCLDDVLAEEG